MSLHTSKYIFTIQLTQMPAPINQGKALQHSLQSRPPTLHPSSKRTYFVCRITTTHFKHICQQIKMLEPRCWFYVIIIHPAQILSSLRFYNKYSNYSKYYTNYTTRNWSENTVYRNITKYTQTLQTYSRNTITTNTHTWNKNITNKHSSSITSN